MLNGTNGIYLSYESPEPHMEHATRAKKEAGDVGASPASADGSLVELGLGMRTPTRQRGAVTARVSRATSCGEAVTRGSAGNGIPLKARFTVRPLAKGRLAG